MDKEKGHDSGLLNSIADMVIPNCSTVLGLIGTLRKEAEIEKNRFKSETSQDNKQT